MSNYNLFYGRKKQFHQIVDDEALGGIKAIDRYLRVRKSFFVRQLADRSVTDEERSRYISVINGINLSLNFLSRIKKTKKAEQ